LQEDDIFKYAYGDDFPEALTTLGAAMLGGRPTNKSLGPLQQLKILVASSEYRASTPRRAGKGKPLPASECEKEMETKSRVDAQKAARRLILPKHKSESADAFIRRLDAHRQVCARCTVVVAPRSTFDILTSMRLAHTTRRHQKLWWRR
jgi:hypothetical protein